MRSTIWRLLVCTWVVFCGVPACYERSTADADTADETTHADTDTNAAGDTDVDTDTKPDSDTGIDTDTVDTSDDTGTTLEELCENTHGLWDPWSCGSYHCGIRPDCKATIPGCNCGLGWVFDDNEGCIASEECPSCPDPGDPEVDYVRNSYLNPATCDMIDFECEEDKYIPFECGCGCIKSEACLQCERSGGEWIYLSCGNWYCGAMPTCDELMPGCNCGAEKTVDPDTFLCVVTDECLERR